MEPSRVSAIRLAGFRAFDELNLSFDRESSLPGDWTCVAGINGSGKSSLLQALCVALLGESMARELGGERLNRMRRVVDGERAGTRIEVDLEFPESGRRSTIRMFIGPGGSIESDGGEHWQRVRPAVVLAAYGATRNLSSRLDTSHDNLSADVRRVITMFDPLSQLANAETLLRQQSASETAMSLFENLAAQVFGDELTIASNGDGVKFTVSGLDRVDALDLPDGFRASAAWLADLCAIWASKSPESARRGDPSEIRGIVMVDEIDLHLHPKLQRMLVPKLREALPNVQWIVTTHSPLVLSNFDSNEIVALDRTVEGGIRPLDRQILGFTADQIYKWLMDAEPSGGAIEQILSRPGGERTDEEIAELLTVSPETGPHEAKKQVGMLKETIERLRP